MATLRKDSIFRVTESNSLRSSTHLSRKNMSMKQPRSKQARLLVIASCLLGLCLLSGCGSGGSVEPDTASPAQSPQMKKFDELNAKSEAAEKSRRQ